MKRAAMITPASEGHDYADDPACRASVVDDRACRARPAWLVTTRYGGRLWTDCLCGRHLASFLAEVIGGAETATVRHR